MQIDSQFHYVLENVNATLILTDFNTNIISIKLYLE